MIDQLANKILDELRVTKDRFENASAIDRSHIKSVIEAQLRKCNLVTREEFDAQKEVLAKTRAKLEELDAALAKLEQAKE